MRSVVRSIRQLRRLTRHHAEGGHASVNRLVRQQNAVILCSSTSRSLTSLSAVRLNDEVNRFMSPGVEILRSMFSTIAADSIKGFSVLTLLCLEPSYFLLGAFDQRDYFPKLCQMFQEVVRWQSMRRELHQESL
jgi:hypothetical protein